MSNLPRDIVRLSARILPHSLDDWGRAMEAELATLEGRDRWVFAAGCLRAALLAPSRFADNAVGPTMTATVVAMIIGCLALTAYSAAEWPHAMRAISGGTIWAFAASIGGYCWITVRPPRALVAHAAAVRIGTIAGAIMMVSATVARTITGFVWPTEFGENFGIVILLALLFTALIGVPFVVARRERSFGAGMTAAIWAGLVSTIIGYNADLIVTVLGVNFEGHIRETVPKLMGSDNDTFLQYHMASHLEATMDALYRHPRSALVMGVIGAALGRVSRRAEKRNIIVAA